MRLEIVLLFLEQEQKYGKINMKEVSKKLGIPYQSVYHYKRELEKARNRIKELEKSK